MKVLIDKNTTEFCLEDTGKEGYRLAIRNRYINYESVGYLFCYGDIEYITEPLKKFINGELKDVISAGTTEPDLNIVFCPKGARTIREPGEDIDPHYTIVDGQKQIIEKYYKYNSIILEVDLCLTGCYGIQHWSARLNKEETNEFCKQWLAEMQE